MNKDEQIAKLTNLVAELRRLLDIEEQKTKMLKDIIKDAMQNKTTWVGGPK